MTDLRMEADPVQDRLSDRPDVLASSVPHRLMLPVVAIFVILAVAIGTTLENGAVAIIAAGVLLAGFLSLFAGKSS